MESAYRFEEVKKIYDLKTKVCRSFHEIFESYWKCSEMFGNESLVKYCEITKDLSERQYFFNELNKKQLLSPPLDHVLSNFFFCEIHDQLVTNRDNVSSFFYVTVSIESIIMNYIRM